MFDRSFSHRGLLVPAFALCLALCTSPLFAQSSALASSAPANPTASSLRPAQSLGQAESAVLNWVLANSGPLHGNAHVGAYRIAFTVTPAEGWWDKAEGGKLQWHDAPANNVHLRIFVASLDDGRLINGLTLRAVLIDSNGNRQSVPADFGWYPLINAYGGNVPLAADSNYTLRVTIEPPFDPHSSHERPTVVDFSPVPIAQEDVSHLALATAVAPATEAELLKPCIAALRPAITALWQHSISGAEKASGDYFVGYALGDPTASALIKNAFRSGGADKVRFAVLARDSRTGRLIPELNPQVEFVTANGKLYSPGVLTLQSQPWLMQYQGEAHISGRGLYTLRIHIDAPGFRRWGRASERFALPADVEFDELSLTPKKS